MTHPEAQRQLEALALAKRLTLEHKDEVDADAMLNLAIVLWREADIDQFEFAEILRIYANWLEDDEPGLPKPRRHLV